MTPHRIVNLIYFMRAAMQGSIEDIQTRYVDIDAIEHIVQAVNAGIVQVLMKDDEVQPSLFDTYGTKWARANRAQDSQAWDNSQALSEGWDLFSVDGRLQLQRIDDPQAHEFLDYFVPKFDSDTSALIYVARLADNGSTYHLQALNHIGTLAE